MSKIQKTTKGIQMKLENRIENILVAQTISGVYSGADEIKFVVDCLMELAEELPCYLQFNISNKKKANPDQYDPDFMIFLNGVSINKDGEYEITYSVDNNLRFSN